MTSEQILLSEGFIKFKEHAIDYCMYLENTKTASHYEFLINCQRLLTRLYLDGIDLVLPDIFYNEDYVEEILAEDYTQIIKNINDQIPESLYWQVFNPFDNVDNNPVCGDLSGDLFEIYIDLKRGLHLIDIETSASIENGIWELSFGFRHHWGDHCINALKAIHSLFPLLK